MATTKAPKRRTPAPKPTTHLDDVTHRTRAQLASDKRARDKILAKQRVRRDSTTGHVGTAKTRKQARTTFAERAAAALAEREKKDRKNARARAQRAYDAGMREGPPAPNVAHTSGFTPKPRDTKKLTAAQRMTGRTLRKGQAAAEVVTPRQLRNGMPVPTAGDAPIFVPSHAELDNLRMRVGAVDYRVATVDLLFDVRTAVQGAGVFVEAEEDGRAISIAEWEKIENGLQRMRILVLHPMSRDAGVFAVGLAPERRAVNKRPRCARVAFVAAVSKNGVDMLQIVGTHVFVSRETWHELVTHFGARNLMVQVDGSVTSAVDGSAPTYGWRRDDEGVWHDTPSWRAIRRAFVQRGEALPEWLS